MFIILGIVIVLILSLAFYVSRKTTAEPQFLERESFADYISSCLAQTGTEGIYKIAAQGGYVNPKGDTAYGETGDGLPVQYYLGQHQLPYVLDGNKTSMRSLSYVDTALSRYLAVELPHCLNFSFFQGQGYTVSVPTINWEAIDFDFSKATVPYSPEGVRFSVVSRDSDVVIVAKYPVLFAKKDSSFVLSDFSTTVPLRLSLLEHTAEKLVEQISNAYSNRTAYDLFLHCAEYASSDKQVNIYATPNLYSADYAVMLIDAAPTSQGLAPLRYQFAVRNVLFGGLCVG